MKYAIAALGLSTFVMSGAALPAQAATYDGEWSVLIVTEQGSCDRAYRYPVKISNGVVSYNGQNKFNVSGRVQSNGSAQVTVSKGNQAASGSGRLSGKNGRGTWRAPDGGCSGKWTAEKRG
jgi:hypothetical protein